MSDKLQAMLKGFKAKKVDAEGGIEMTPDEARGLIDTCKTVTFGDAKRAHGLLDAIGAALCLTKGTISVPSDALAFLAPARRH